MAGLPDKALAAAALSSLTWGLTGVFIKLLPAIPPVSVTAGRLLVAFLAVLPAIIVSASLRSGFVLATRTPVAYLLAAQMAAYYLVATAAFQLAPVAEVALLVSTQPLFVLLFRRFSGESPHTREVSGALLATAGIVVILLPQLGLQAQRSVGHLLGDLLAIGASMLSAGFATVYGHLSRRGASPDSTGVTLLSFLMGAVLTGAWVVLVGGGNISTLISRDAWPMLLGLGIVSTAVPTLGYALASKQLPAIMASTISLLIPVSSGLFAYLLLGETLSLWFLAGGLMVLAGVMMIIRR